MFSSVFKPGLNSIINRSELASSKNFESEAFAEFISSVIVECIVVTTGILNLFGFKNKSGKASSVEERKGFYLRRKLINNANERVCCKCETYSFSKRDDLYLTKYFVCEKCFFLFVDGREEKWEKYLEEKNNG